WGQGRESRSDWLAGGGEWKPLLLTQHGEDRGERAPVAVDEAAVPAARPVPADLRLQDRDAQLRRLLAQRERRPEAGVPAADDCDIRGRIARERGCRHRIALARKRVLQPPRGQAWLDGRKTHAFFE